MYNYNYYWITVILKKNLKHDDSQPSTGVIRSVFFFYNLNKQIYRHLFTVDLEI